MKTINITISDDSVASSVIGYLNSQISESTRNSTEFKILYPQITACLDDFATKAKKLPNAGTTIHIQKEFALPDLSILVALDYPKKKRFFEKLTNIFKRDR